MKTSELTGVLLDYWVANAVGEGNGGDFDMFMSIYRIGFLHYSTEWGLAGPLIERKLISIAYCNDGIGKGWIAYATPNHQGLGNTPLIAAMRAFVASKFGEVVPEKAET